VARAALAVAALASATASWITGSPLPEPRTEVAAAALGSRIVVVGGFLANGGNSRRVDSYDPRRDAWTRLPDLPVSVDHAAAASWRGRLVIVGGYGADREPLRAAFLYDGRRWQRLPAPPEERAAAAAAATSDGRVWVVGGRTRSGLATRALSLDLRTLRWRAVRGPRPREHLAATALAGRVFAIGGRLAGYDTNLAAVEAYDPRTNRWSRLPDLPDPRGGTGATSIAGRIVSVGGESPAGTNRTVWALRPGARSWTALPDLPTPRHGLGVVAFGGRVWVIGGGPQPGLTVSGAVESLPIP
jgi:N-acetylneuraminic acid mutarotase